MPILQWLDRNKNVKAAETVPYRLLEADDTHSGGDLESPNMLIQGDNLEALKALLPYYAGRVNCIFIDPPYNTRSAFEHYDDNLEHSQWLAMMFPRLSLLSELLTDEGSIWVTLDDLEAHYMKVIMDEVFGRTNFIWVAIWRNQTVHEWTQFYSRIVTITSSSLRRTSNQSCSRNCLRTRYPSIITVQTSTAGDIIRSH